MQYRTENERTAAAALSYGKMTDSQRLAQAGQTTTWTLDLQVAWEHVQKHIPMITLPNKIQVIVYLKTLDKCVKVDTAGTLTCTISNPILRIQGVHVSQNDRLKIMQLANTDNGYAVKSFTYEYHMREPLAASSTATQYRIKLTNIKNLSVKLDIAVRPQAAVDNTGGTALDLWTFARPQRFWIEDGGNQVTPKIPFNDTTGTKPNGWGPYSYNVRGHPDGEVGLPIGTIFFCHPEFFKGAFDDCVGGRALYRFNNPELILEWDTAPNVAYYVDIWSFMYQYIPIIQKGDLRKWLR